MIEAKDVDPTLLQIAGYLTLQKELKSDAKAGKLVDQLGDYIEEVRRVASVVLGAVMRDRISGFEGIVIARTEWITGCATVGLQPPCDKDGKLPEDKWFDETRLELVKPAEQEEEVAKLPDATGDVAAAGGLRSKPQRDLKGR